MPEAYVCFCGGSEWQIFNGEIQCCNSDCRRTYRVEINPKAYWFNEDRNQERKQ